MHSTSRPASMGSMHEPMGETDSTVLATPIQASKPRFRTSQAALETQQLLEAIQEIDLQHELRGFLIRENILHTSPRGGSEPLKLHDYSTYSQREGPVRLEMMKALARKWKLHFQPGFWRKHENRRDLMHALIAHGRNLYEKQEGEDAVLLEAPRRTPAQPVGAQTLRLPSIRPVIRPDMHDSRQASTAPTTPPEAIYEPLQAPVFNREIPIFLPYKGDVFGTQGDYSDALLYRSRHGMKPSNLHHTAPAAGGRFPSHSKSVTFSTNAVDAEPPSGSSSMVMHVEADEGLEEHESIRQDLMPSTSEVARHELNLRHQAAKALRDLSRNPINRLEIVEEGAHVALLEVLGENQSEEAIWDCSVAFANLSSIQPPNAASALQNDQKKWVAIRRAARSRAGLSDNRGLSHRPSLSQLLSGISSRSQLLKGSGGSFAVVANAGNGQQQQAAAAPTDPEGFWKLSGSTGQFIWPDPNARNVYVDSVEFSHHGRYLYAEPSLYRGVVTALHDIANGSSLKYRVVVATCLYNMSCNCSYWPALVEERAVDALLYCLKSVEESVAEIPEGALKQLFHPTQGKDASILHDLSTNALLLEICVRALCNLSNDRRGARQIAEQRAIQLISSIWHFLRWELQTSVIAYLAFNLSAHVYTAEACVSQGLLSLLYHAVLQLDRPNDDFHLWLITRMVCIFSNLTVTPKLSRELLREKGGEPFQRVLVLLQTFMDETAEDAAAHGNPFTPTSLSELANSEVTNAFRMAAEALSRMLWAGMSDVAANQGLCVPLANLLLSDHPETQHAAALAVCNLVRSPEASIIAASDGVIAALVRLVLSRPSGTSPMPIIAMAFYNTSCFEHGCQALLSLKNFDIGIGSPSDSSRNLLSEAEIPGVDANVPAASALILLIEGELRRLEDEAEEPETIRSLSAMAAEWSPLVDGSTAPFLQTERFRVISFALATLRNLSSVSAHWSAQLVKAGIVRLALRFLDLPGPSEVLHRRSQRTVSPQRNASKRGFDDSAATVHGPCSWRFSPLAQMPVQIVGDAIHVLANLTVDSDQRQEIIRQGALMALSPVGRNLSSSVLEASRQVSMMLIKEKVEARAAQYAAQVVARRGEEEENAQEKELQAKEAKAMAEKRKAPATQRNSAKPPVATKPGQSNKAAPPAEEEASRTRRSSIRKVLQEQKRAAMMAEEKARQLSKAREDMHADRETARVQRTFDSSARVSSLALSNLACDADQETICDERYEVIPTLVSLLIASEDGDIVRPRVVSALNQLSRNHAIAKLMISGGVIQAIVPICGSEDEDVRRHCVGVLYNLSTHPGSEPVMGKSGVVKALNVMALIRTHDASTQAKAVDTLYNIMTDPEVRIEVLQQGVIWMLQKLSLSVNTETQRACSVALYRLSCDERAQGMLVREGGIRSVISVLLAYFRKQQGQSGPNWAPEEEEESEEELNLFMLSNLARSTEEVGAADELVAALFAGILSVISRKKGNEELLVREGAVEALVMLAQRGSNEAAGRNSLAALDPLQSASQASSTIMESTSAASRRYAAVLSSFGGSGESDVGALRSSCAEGLCNLTQSPKASIRQRVLQGGACDVFVSVGTASSESMATRRLCLLGTVNLLWDAAPNVYDRGSISRLLECVILKGDWKDRYASTIVLHSPLFHVEEDTAAMTKATAPTVPRALLLLLHLVVSALQSETGDEGGLRKPVPQDLLAAVNSAGKQNDDYYEGCSFVEETLMLLMHAILPIAKNDALAKQFYSQGGIELLCTAIRLLLQRIRAGKGSETSDVLASLDPLRAWAIMETLSMFASAIAMFATYESTSEGVVIDGAVEVMSNLVHIGPNDAVRARALVALRNITSWPHLRAQALERGGLELLQRLVATTTAKRRGDTSLLVFGDGFVDNSAISTSTLWKSGASKAARTTRSSKDSAALVASVAELNVAAPASGGYSSDSSEEENEVPAALPSASASLSNDDRHIKAIHQAITLFPLQADAGKCLCNLTREAKRYRSLLTRADTATGLITISDHNECGANLRHSCLQALCELTIDDERVPSGAAQEEAIEELKASTGQVTALIAVINAKREKEMQLGEADSEGNALQDWCLGDEDPIATTAHLPPAGDARLFPDTRAEGIAAATEELYQEWQQSAKKEKKSEPLDIETPVMSRPNILGKVLAARNAAATPTDPAMGPPSPQVRTKAVAESEVWPKITDESIAMAPRRQPQASDSMASTVHFSSIDSSISPGPIPTLSRDRSFAERSATRQAALRAANSRKHKRVRRGSVMSVEVAPILDAASMQSSMSDASRMASPPPGAAPSMAPPEPSAPLFSIDESKGKNSLMRPEKQLAVSVQVAPSPNAWWKDKSDAHSDHDGGLGSVGADGFLGVFISFPTVLEPDAVLSLQRDPSNHLTAAYRDPEFLEVLRSVSHYGGALRDRISAILRTRGDQAEAKEGEDPKAQEEQLEELMEIAWEKDRALQKQVKSGSSTYLRRLSLSVYPSNANSTPGVSSQHHAALLRSGLGTGKGILPNSFAIRNPFEMDETTLAWPSYHLFRLVNAGEAQLSQIEGSKGGISAIPPSATMSESMPLTKWTLRLHHLIPGVAASIYNFVALRMLGFSPQIVSEIPPMLEDGNGKDVTAGSFKDQQPPSSLNSTHGSRAVGDDEVKRQLLTQHQDELLRASEMAVDDAADQERPSTHGSILGGDYDDEDDEARDRPFRRSPSDADRSDTRVSSRTSHSRPSSRHWDRNQEEEIIREVVRTRRSSHPTLLGPTVLFLPQQQQTSQIDELIDSLPPVVAKRNLVWQPSSSDEAQQGKSEPMVSRWHVGVFTKESSGSRKQKRRSKSPRKGQKVSPRVLAQSNRLYRNETRQGEEASALRSNLAALEPHPPMSPIRRRTAHPAGPAPNAPTSRPGRRVLVTADASDPINAPQPRSPRVSSFALHNVKQSPYQPMRPKSSRPSSKKSKQ